MRQLPCFLLSFLICFLLLAPGGVAAQDGPEPDTLFQFASIESLLQGVYDTGEHGLSCGQLLQHGDTGLGTFNSLDGEMVVLDGVVWQVRDDGSTTRMPDFARTPFACVTMFQQERRLTLENVQSFDDLAERIRQATAEEPNMIYALRATGGFSSVRTRSVSRQKRPFPPLVEAVQNQPVFDFTNQAGDLVGFYLPDMLQGVNVPGLHLHFLTNDRKSGGHVLELQTKKLELWLDATPAFTLQLPEGGDFQKAPLDGRTGEELHKVER